MKAHNYSIRHNLIIILILLFPVGSMATVKEVTLFPNSAKISETAKINPQCDKGKCISVITLPSQADPESFVVSLPAQSHVKIEDVQIKPVPVQDETKIAELRKQIAGLEASKKEMQAKLQALEVQLQFWQAQTKAKTKTLADTNKLADAIGKNVRRANQEKFAVEIQLEKSDKNIKKLQDELNQIAGKKETAWEMTLTTSGVG